MTESLKKYYKLIEKYKTGDYGEQHLTVNEILEKSGEKDMFEKMTSSEILFLIEKSSGIIKQFFYELYLKKTNVMENTIVLNKIIKNK